MLKKNPVISRVYLEENFETCLSKLCCGQKLQLSHSLNIDDYEVGLRKDMISFIASRMGTFLTSPELYLVKQGETGRDLYFIAQGDCTVDVVGFDG